ncbi:uncharacterized protein [Nicotiana sylvestris]|uniref:uncharacterized protein n=1 Tax=Nicotiana sylvestris TaxID=4096 RepID=UPI00388CA559
MLTTEYELFEMKEDGSIQDMHTCFTFIINELHSLGEVIPRNKLVQKILSVLPGSWESKVNDVTEAKDLQKLTIDELIGNLKTYEMKRKKDLERRETKKEKNLDHYKTNTKKATKRNQVLDRKFNRRDVADNMVKQALVDWGNSSSESEGENMMVADNGSSEYESIFALMAKSDDDEDKEEDEEKEIGGIEQERDYMVVSIEDLEEIIKSLKKEKEVLAESNANIEHERDDLLVVVINLKETIRELKMKPRPENSQKGKEVASEALIKLEIELNSVKSSLCAELEKNKQL